MAIDTSMFSRFMEPAKSVQDFDNERQTAEANKLNLLIGRQNLGMNSLKMDETRRGFERQNELRNLMGRVGALAPDARINALRTGGFVTEGDAAEKAWLERQKAEAEVQSKKLADAKTKIGIMASSSKFVVDNPSYDSLVAQSKFLIENKLITPEQAEAGLAQAKDMTPEQIRTKALLGFQSAIDAEKQLPKTDITNMGGTQSFGSTDIYGNRKETGTAPITQSANSIAEGQVRVAEGDKDRQIRRDTLAETKRHHGIIEGKDGSGKAPTLTTIIDPADPTKMITVDARRWNPTTREGLVGMSGKEPTALKREEQATTGKEQVSTMVASLRDMYDQLDTGGGIVNSDKSALSNIPARLSSTGAGQFAGQLGGTKNQKLRDSIEQQRPLLLNAIKQATGMSAKQLDSNIELRMYLAAATDPTKDVAANRAALDNLEKLFATGNLAKKPDAPKAKTIVRTGTQNGRKVIEYSDGSIEYAN